MNRYMPLVMLVVFGQASIAYLLVDRVVMYRLFGPQPEELEEVRKVDIDTSDEPARIYRDLGEFLLNPADTSSTQGVRFIRTQISLGVSPAKVHSALASWNPRVRDIIIGILTSKTVSEMDNPEDREFIKDEIRFSVEDMLSEIFVKGEVLQVNFTEFIIQ